MTSVEEFDMLHGSDSNTIALWTKVSLKHAHNVAEIGHGENKQMLYYSKCRTLEDRQVGNHVLEPLFELKHYAL